MAQVESLIARVVLARSQVLGAVSGVSPGQGAWKPAPTEWSIAECVEHLVVAEQGGVSGTWAAVEGLRAGNPVWKGEPMHRGLTIEEVVRRTWAPDQQAPDRALPLRGGPLSYWAAALENSQRLVDRLGVLLVGMDLETVIFPHAVSGPLDASQRLAFLRFHLDLHRKQIEAIRLDPRFGSS